MNYTLFLLENIGTSHVTIFSPGFSSFSVWLLNVFSMGLDQRKSHKEDRDDGLTKISV